ncbi:MAG: TraB/GumN family protein [Treponema sp.]|nr:TraB/GumN family protein [Treponema sp.]
MTLSTVKKGKTGRSLCLLLLLTALMMTSCATMGKKAATLTECPERMLWRIDGLDKKGNPSTVYIQGSFHLGDDRMYPLQKGVVDAWTGADRLVAEVASKDYQQLQPKILELMISSLQKAGGRKVTDALTEEQNKTLLSLLDKDTVDNLVLFEPWVTTYSLAGMIYANSGLASEYGLDSGLLASAIEEGRGVEGLDELQVQLDIITYGSYEEQLDMLRELLDELKDPKEEIEDVKNMYAAYLANDRKAFDKLNQESIAEDEAKHEFYKGYYKMLLTDRNKDWAKDIAGYLREGGTTFIFAGSAHWVGNESVFNYMRKAGTLE